MGKYQTVIGIRKATYDELKNMKEEGQSFDGVIQKLIRVYKSTILEAI